MIQKSYYSAHEKKPPQKFIPRRDLFPDAELPPPNKTSTAKITSGKRSPDREQSGNAAARSQTAQMQQARVQPVHTDRIPVKKAQPLPLQQPLHPVNQKNLLSVNPTTLFLLLAGWFLLWPKLKKAQPKLTSNIQSAFRNVLDNPKSIQMLRTLGPYLEDKEQDAVFTVAGIMEAAGTFRDVMKHTYQDRNRNTILHVPSDPTAKRIEIMKAVKPYIPRDSRKKLDQVIGVYDTVDQLNRNIEIYRNNLSLAGDKKAAPIESIGEILKVVRPVLPQEYREKADQAIQMLKMAEVMESADKMSRNGKKEKESPQKKVRNTGREKTAEDTTEQAAEAIEKSAGKADQMQKIMDSFLPMLNDEQKESMDMILKMAQLLAQPGDSSGTDSKEEE